MKILNPFVRLVALALALVTVMSCGGPGSGNRKPKSETGKAARDTVEETPPTGDAEAAKATLEQLFQLVQEGNGAEACKYLVYRGDNAEEAWTRPYRCEVPEEKVEADKLTAKLQALLYNADATRFTEFIAERESEGVWHVWKVTIDYVDGSHEEVTFALLAVGDSLLLGDVD